jgi:hypothetical protein
MANERGAASKDKFTVRLKKDAVKIIDALRGEKTRTACLEEIVNDVLFNKIQKYVDKIGSIDRRIDAALARIETRLDKISGTVQKEGLVEGVANTPEGERGLNYVIAKVNAIDRALNVDVVRSLGEIKGLLGKEDR